MYDRFNRRINYLRISVTDLCNMRCVYCMPAEGVQLLDHDRILTFEEIRDLVQVGVSMGIDKVRLTGGEPLVRRGIITLVEMINSISGIADFAITTNAVFLPEYADALKEAGITRLNISLDTLDPVRFAAISRGGDLGEVLAGIAAAQRTGFRKIKPNCVIDTSPEGMASISATQLEQPGEYQSTFVLSM